MGWALSNNKNTTDFYISLCLLRVLSTAGELLCIYLSSVLEYKNICHYIDWGWHLNSNILLESDVSSLARLSPALKLRSNGVHRCGPAPCY